MTTASQAPLYCNPLLLEDDPSFTGGSPLAARFYFVKRGENRTWIWGGTTALFFNAIVSKIQNLNLSTNSPFSARVAYQPPNVGGTVTYGGLSGAAWDNDFNRALWNTAFRVWDDYARRMGQSSAYEQFLGLHREDTTAAWMNVLAEIRRCETERRVNATAFSFACRLAASWFGLLDNLTTPLASPIPGTRMPSYGQNFPAASDPGELAYRPLIWPSNGTIYDGQFPAFAGRAQVGVACPSPQSYQYGVNGAAPEPSAPLLTATTGTSSQPRATTGGSTRTGGSSTSGSSAGGSNTMDPGKTLAPVLTPMDSPAAKVLLPAGYALGGVAILGGAGYAVYAAWRARRAQRSA